MAGVKLQVRLFAVLRERAGTDCLVLPDLPGDLDVAGLKRHLTAQHPELGSLEGVRGVLGTTYVEDATPLADGQELSLLPPVSGGEDGEDLTLGVFELSAEPLDPEQARRRVGHPTCGGTVVFTGTTRDRNRGEDVEHLDYEAFAEMAQTEMASLFARCRERFGPPSAEGTTQPGKEALAPGELELRMLTLHRTGRVGVGEPSVVVAVASPHRDAAFNACRFLIDELKRSVPLWKKESYADGHHWIGDRS